MGDLTRGMKGGLKTVHLCVLTSFEIIMGQGGFRGRGDKAFTSLSQIKNQALKHLCDNEE